MKTLKIIPPVTLPNSSILPQSGEVFVAGGCFLKMENEIIFYPIDGFNNNYEISKCGLVRRIDKGRFMKRVINNRGYYCVILCDQRKEVKHNSGRQLIHRLICKTFLPNPENKRTVNHKDGNKLNNNLENLEWATDKENINHAFDTDLNQHSDKHYRSKLTNAQVIEIRNLKGLMKLKDAAKIYGVSETTIVNTMNRKVYKRVK